MPASRSARSLVRRCCSWSPRSSSVAKSLSGVILSSPQDSFSPQGDLAPVYNRFGLPLQCGEERSSTKNASRSEAFFVEPQKSLPHLDDGELLGARRGVHLDLVAGFMAHEGLPDG